MSVSSVRHALAELDLVVLTRDLPEFGLAAGDVGAVVHRYPDAAGFEVEFVTASGETVAAATLAPADVRALVGREILHARDLALTG